MAYQWSIDRECWISCPPPGYEMTQPPGDIPDVLPRDVLDERIVEYEVLFTDAEGQSLSVTESVLTPYPVAVPVGGGGDV